MPKTHHLNTVASFNVQQISDIHAHNTDIQLFIYNVGFDVQLALLVG